ncbi:MAG TPA: very short patch repair endonuclease [Sedimentisphaerales bacterium]|nr:very short patch repair endonuclease [Sedimentisphaerales bacterium]
MDSFTKEFRSEIMRAVKSKENRSTELRLIALFKQHGIKGWRRHAKIFGHPDFYFWKLKLVVFADGCFWHGCKCKKKQPKNNAAYWRSKVERNKRRDKLVTNELRRRGYKVVRIRECAIKKGRLPRNLPLMGTQGAAC